MNERGAIDDLERHLFCVPILWSRADRAADPRSIRDADLFDVRPTRRWLRDDEVPRHRIEPAPNQRRPRALHGRRRAIFEPLVRLRGGGPRASGNRELLEIRDQHLGRSDPRERRRAHRTQKDRKRQPGVVEPRRLADPRGATLDGGTAQLLGLEMQRQPTKPVAEVRHHDAIRVCL